MFKIGFLRHSKLLLGCFKILYTLPKNTSLCLNDFFPVVTLQKHFKAMKRLIRGTLCLDIHHHQPMSWHGGIPDGCGSFRTSISVVHLHC